MILYTTWYTIPILSCLVCFVLDQLDPFLLTLLQRCKIKPYQNRVPFSSKQLIHSIVAGMGSFYVIWFQTPVELSQPSASFLCKFNTASRLATIIPRISIGYAIHDTLHGIQQGDVPFVLHGLGLFSVLLYMEYRSFITLAVYPLLMEISTIFLTLRALQYKKQIINDLFDLLFAGTFLYIRFVVMTIYMMKYIYMGTHTDPSAWGSCMSFTTVKIAMFFYTFFMCLNIFWSRILLRKMKRRCCIRCCDWDPYSNEKKDV